MFYVVANGNGATNDVDFVIAVEDTYLAVEIERALSEDQNKEK